MSFEEVFKLERAGDFTKMLQRILDESGRLRTGLRENPNSAWYSAGVAAHRLGDLGAAIRYFKKAFISDESDFGSLLAIANCHSELGRPRWALHYLRKAAILSPEDWRVRYNTGNALYDLKIFDEAREIFRAVAREAPAEISELARRNLALWSEKSESFKRRSDRQQ